MENRTFSIGDVFGQGFEFFKKHWMLALIILGVAIVTDIIQSIFQPVEVTTNLTSVLEDCKDDPARMLELLTSAGIFGAQAQIGSIIGYLVKTFADAGILFMVMLIVKHVKDELSFEAFALPIEVYLKFVVVDILVSILTVIGLVFCIVPGIIVGIRLQFAGTRILDDRNCGIIDAIKYSWNITSGNTGTLFLVCLVEFVLVIAGFICCCVGVLAAIAWSIFTDMVIYFTLKPEVTEPAAIEPEQLIEA